MPNRIWRAPFPLTTLLLVSAIASAASFGLGCQTRCIKASDCGSGSYCTNGRCETECFIDEDCRNPPECQSNPTACVPRGFLCNSSGRCTGQLKPDYTGTVRDVNAGQVGPTEGWDDPPGTGKAFIINFVEIGDEDSGINVDDECQNGECNENILWPLGDLGNQQINQGLLGGESLLLLEFVGLNIEQGQDPNLTIKAYGARDADDPYFPTNNFNPVIGYPTCCQFKINPLSIIGPPPQARARARARIGVGELERGQLLSEKSSVVFTLTVGSPPYPEIRIERAQFSGRLNARQDSFYEGRLGGAVPISTLALTTNPYCRDFGPRSARCTRTYSSKSTLIDLVAALLSDTPDVDLDKDGLECVLDTDGDGRIDRCCDGFRPGDRVCKKNQNECLGEVVPPLDPQQPWTCALNGDKMRDGYSVSFNFTAVDATIVGIQ